MGFITLSDDVTLDAVLTDIGRSKLARNDNSFNITSYVFADDEVDYNRFNPTTGSAQMDRDLLNVPVFEAVVNEKLNFEYPLMIITNPNLKYIPKLKADNDSVSIGEEEGLSSGVTLRYFQSTNRNAKIVPVEIQDSAYKIEMNNDLLHIEDESPLDITSHGTAIYALPRDATLVQSTQASQITFQVRTQTINNSTWDTLGVSASSGADRTIETKVKVTGLNSGLSSEVTITINEQFDR